MRPFVSTWIAASCLFVFAGLPHTARAASCAFGSPSGPEVTLQGVFTEMFGSAAPNATTDCIAEPGDGLWQTVNSVSSATILVEIAGNADGNTLGIYDSTSTLNSLEIFSGPAASGSRAFITVSGAPGAFHVQVDRFTGTTYTGSVSSIFATQAFGFYLRAGATGERFYSESFRNAGGTDHMYSYLGNGATFRNGSLYAPDMVEGTQFANTDAIIAWEDLHTGSDRDYQDMVVLLRDIVPTPVPLPAGVWLLASALLGCTLLGRRRLT